MRNVKIVLEKDRGVYAGAYVDVHLYEDGSADLDGCFEVEDLQVILEVMQSKRKNNNKEEK